MRNYVKADFYRVITSRSFLGAVAGVFAMNMLGCMQCSFTVDVISIQYFSNMYSLFILVFAFGSMAYANSMVEDSEHKFWYLAIQKGNIQGYAKSKILTAFFSAIVATVLGTMLFVFVERVRMPFFDSGNIVIEEIAAHSVWGDLIRKGWGIAYFLGVSFLQGILAGILALVSMLLSLCVKSRMFTICIPVIGFYFFTNYLGNMTGYLNLSSLYIAGMPVFENNLLSICYDLLLASVIYWGMEAAIIMKLEKEIKGK